MTFDYTIALGHHCETFFFHTFWISYWNLKFLNVFLSCVSSYIWKSFLSKSGSRVLKLTSIQSKSRSTQRCDLADWHWNLNVASFLFLFYAMNFISFRLIMTTGVYNPCSIAMLFMLSFTSIGILIALFALSLHFFIQSS